MEHLNQSHMRMNLQDQRQEERRRRTFEPEQEHVHHVHLSDSRYQRSADKLKRIGAIEFLTRGGR